MSKIQFTKEYERDISLVLEAVWARNIPKFISEWLKIEPKQEPFIIFYVTADNMQIWENSGALFSWYQECLLKKNNEDPEFMLGTIVEEYKKIVLEIEKYFKQGSISDKEKLKSYMNLMTEGAKLFSAWYYSLIDERTPANIREKLLELRSKDEFFAQNDIFIKDCLEKLGVKRELTNFVFPEEFPYVPSEEDLLSRKGGVVCVGGNDNYVMALEDFSNSHPEYEFKGLKNNFENIEELRGQAAFVGNVSGQVKIVKNVRSMERVKEGDIMVSPMTTPDFMPAMKKSAAFITDEGGVTCHAAIVAREMKKPCIIGTKIATQVLKDGDEVEVDAEKGIVKILKKNN